MAGNDEEPERTRGKGFAGLGKMVSDVDAAIADAGKAASRSERQSTSKASDASTKGSPPPSQQPPVYSPPPGGSNSSSKKWMIGLAAFAALALFIGFSVDGSKSTTTPTIATPSDFGSLSEPSIPSAPTRPTEVPPAIGRNNVLAGAQLRYCVAEKIRLDAAEQAVNSYDGIAVDRFNSYIGDYNSRCGEFRYREGSLQGAERAMEPFRQELEAEGRGRVIGARPTGANRQTGESQEQSPPDATVLAIQRRLSALGYDVGVADGRGGPRTTAAIKAFQLDGGGVPDGRATQQLLTRLSETQNRPTSPSGVPSRDDQEALGTAARLEEAPGSGSRGGSDPSSLMAQLSTPERESLESACSTAKYTQGPSAYSACVSRQLAALIRQPSRPDLAELSSSERESIESACSTAKYTQGPGPYNACLVQQLQARNRQGGTPDLSRLTSPERESIESACSTQKYTKGPAAYNACLTSQLSSLSQQGGRPNLAGLSTTEKESIESACSTAKYTQGPAAYNRCLSRQLSDLSALPERASLAGLAPSIRTSVESACSTEKYTQGPAAYNSCLLRQLARR